MTPTGDTASTPGRTPLRETREVLTLSNGITLLRLLLVSAAIWFLAQERMREGLALLLIAVSTDALDGYFAHRSGVGSAIGRLLDPVVDKICVAALALFLADRMDFPLWFLVAVLARDGAMIALWLAVSRMRRVPLRATAAGRWGIGITALALFTYAAGAPPAFKLAALSAAVAMLGVSTWSYARIFLASWRAHGCLPSASVSHNA